MAVNPSAFRRGYKSDPVAQRESNALRQQFFRSADQRLWTPLGETPYLASAVSGSWTAGNQYLMVMPPIREQFALNTYRVYVVASPGTSYIALALYIYDSLAGKFTEVTRTRALLNTAATGLQSVDLEEPVALDPGQRYWLGFLTSSASIEIEAMDTRTVQKLYQTSGYFKGTLDRADLTLDTSGTNHPFVVCLSKTEKELM